MSKSESMSHSHRHVAQCCGHLVQLAQSTDAFAQVANKGAFAGMANLHVVIFPCISRADVRQGIS